MNKNKKNKKKESSIKDIQIIQKEIVKLENETLPVLAAGLAHEVKNPLAAIHLHLQLMENQIQLIDKKELRESLLNRIQIIKKEILSLNRLLQEFLKIIRSEKKSFQIQELNDLIPSIISLLRPQAHKVGAEIYFYPGKIPMNLEIDPIFIKQILINLIINSIQAFYSDNSNPKNKKIEIYTGIENDIPYIRVADNGPGIPKEIQHKIFEPFFTTKQEGSGLGLALVKKMVEEMNGSIEFISKENEGTIFTIYFYPKSIKDITIEIQRQKNEIEK
jgi:signal transduction histidine kinase